MLGEVVVGIEDAYELTQASGPALPGNVADSAVYHYYPSLEQVRTWIDQVGLVIEEEETGSGYHHFLTRKE